MHRHVFFVGDSRCRAKQPGAGLRIVPNLNVMAVFPLPWRQLINDIGFFSMINTSSFDLMFPFVGYCRIDEVDWLIFDPGDPFMLYHFAIGRFHPLLREVIPG